MQNRRSRRASTSNRIGMALVAVVVLLLIAVLLMRSMTLRKKIQHYNASNTALEEQIRAEEERTQQLAALPAYVESDEYIERLAREKFGLVYEDEIIFKPAQ